MAMGDRRFDHRLSTITIFVISVAAAVAVIAYRTDTHAAVAMVHPSGACGQAGRLVVNPLEAFLECWTNTVMTAGDAE